MVACRPRQRLACLQLHLAQGAREGELSPLACTPRCRPTRPARDFMKTLVSLAGEPCAGGVTNWWRAIHPLASARPRCAHACCHAPLATQLAII